VCPLDPPNPSQLQNSTHCSTSPYEAAEEEELEAEAEVAEAEGEEEEAAEEHHQLNKPSNP